MALNLQRQFFFQGQPKPKQTMANLIPNIEHEKQRQKF
jgi:hypothetical protein